MSKKDLITTLASAGIKDPNYSKSGENPQQIEDKDFTDATNDISAVARVTLGVFLSAKTTKNPYPVSPTSTLLENKTRGENSGLLTPPERNGQDVFANLNDLSPLQAVGLGVKNATVIGAENRQVTFFTEGNLKKLISKNASDSNLSGDSLLKEVPKNSISPIKSIGSPAAAPASGEGRGNELLRLIHEQLTDGNMYSPDAGKPFLKNSGGQNEEEVTHGLFSIQRNLGTFDINGKRVSVSDMSAIAMSNLLRANGNNKGADLVIENKALGLASFTALTPFLRPEQFGATGNGLEFYKFKTISAGGNAAEIARTATGQDDFIIKLGSNNNLITRGVPPNNDELPNLQSTPLNAGSFAQVNTFLEPFAVGTRFSSFSMFLLGAASVLIIVGVALVIDFFSTFTKAKSAENSQDVISRPSTLQLGKHKKSATDPNSLSDTMLEFLQITKTDYDFSECVELGIKLLFGIPVDANVAGQPTALATVAINLLLSGGFYANFARNLISETVSIANVFAKLGTGLTQSVETLLEAIDNILSSAIYRFIMIAAGVGDASLKSQFGMLDLTDRQKILPFSQSSKIDPYAYKKDEGNVTKVNEGGGLGIYRNLLYRWGGAESGQSSMSLKTFFAAQRKLPQGVNTGNVNSGNRFLTPNRSNVEEVENAIESEYMPFYIHDLRTHEIISMPAFITEFGENFTPSYNSVEGIGRQDPVRLYQKTERAVTFGFMLVAFNPDDHDHMWLTINKLVAMCYPQYSKGRIRQTEPDGSGNVTTFIQPFSQVQGASPMVRLRLGDVFKSNYSKFGLMRLFGAGTGNDFSVTKQNQDSVSVSDAEKARDDADAAAVAAVVKRFNDANPQGGLTPGDEVILEEIGKPTSASGSKLKFSIEAGTIATIVSYRPGKNAYKTKKSKWIPAVKAGYIVSIRNQSDTIFVAAESIRFYTLEHAKKLKDVDTNLIEARNKLEAAKRGQNSTPAGEFFSSENNAIVRSFETTRGRGVAGFITSIGLDYGMNSHTWDTSAGKRAPKFVKISLGFTPITDLPLGLDYNGDIRNPSHPVGKYAGAFGDPYEALATYSDGKAAPKSMEEVNKSISDKNSAKVTIDKLKSDLNSNEA